MEPGLYTTAEAAKITGFAVSTLEKMRVSGTGPKFVKHTRAVRYRPQDLEAWAAARVVSSTSEKAA